MAFRKSTQSEIEVAAFSPFTVLIHPTNSGMLVLWTPPELFLPRLLLGGSTRALSVVARGSGPLLFGCGPGLAGRASYLLLLRFVCTLS